MPGLFLLLDSSLVGFSSSWSFYPISAASLTRILPETLAFGFTFSIGVFHEYWTYVLFPDPGAAATVTLVTTLCSGLMYITAVIIGPLFTRYPEHRAKMQYAGLALSVAGIIASAFATKPWHLVVTAGLMYPLGGCTYYFPAATLLFSWWQRKRGKPPSFSMSACLLNPAHFS